MGEQTPGSRNSDSGGRLEAATPPRWTRLGPIALAGLGAAFAIFVFWIVIFGAEWWLVNVDGVTVGGKEGLTGKDLAAALDTIRGRALTLGTGLLAAVAIYYTARNATSARRSAQAALENVEAARRTAEMTEAAQRRTFELTEQGQNRAHELTERGQNTDRFTAAVAQLGDTSPAIQLGGVHALATLADDAPELRQTCIDVLCAFLRLPYEADPGDGPEDDHVLQAQHAQARNHYRAFREVRHTIIRIFGNHLSGHTNVSWRGHDLDFSDVVFDGGDLDDAVFTDAHISFRRARFVSGGVGFRGARFLSGVVDFRDARFEGGWVDFAHARFEGGWVGFEQAQFEGGEVRFGTARFEGGRADFEQAQFMGAEVSFMETIFEGGLVDFWHAGFEEGNVIFGLAQFRGGQVDFRHARFGGARVSFALAGFDGGRVELDQATGHRPEGLPDGMAPHLA